MQAVILASGIGSRLRPFTDHQSKGMVPMAGVPLIARLVGQCLAAGVTDFVVTTGHVAESLVPFCRSLAPKANWQFIHNDRFAETNYIYSLWLARTAIKGDGLLLHTDIVCHPELFNRLAKQTVSSVVVDPTTPLSTKDFVARLAGNLITEIGVGMSGDNTVNCLPLYKLAAADWAAWLAAIDAAVTAGRVNEYAEVVFNRLSPQFSLQSLACQTGEWILEVDTKDDMLRATTLCGNE